MITPDEAELHEELGRGWLDIVLTEGEPLTVQAAIGAAEGFASDERDPQRFTELAQAFLLGVLADALERLSAQPGGE